MVSLLFVPLYFENGFNSGSYFSISNIWGSRYDAHLNYRLLIICTEHWRHWSVR